MLSFFNGSSRSGVIVLFMYSLLMGVLLFSLFSFSYSFLLEILLIKVGSFSFSFPVLFGWESCLVSFVVCFISGCVLIYSEAYMSEEVNFSRFINLIILFVVSMNLLIFIPSLFFLFLGWDGLGIISFVLVVYYQNKNSLGSGMITVLSNRIGDTFLFLSISVSGCMGYWCWEGLNLGGNFISSVDFLIFSLSILIAGMTKSAQFPFCAWLPAAMAAPTPVSALVHSSTLVTAGVFLLCRFSQALLGSLEMCQVLLMISMLTMMVSGMICCVEWDMKKVIAYSTLSQLGLMMFSVSLGMISFGVFHLVTHAVFKALMFLCAGFVIHYSNHSQDLRVLSSFWWISPVMSGSILVSVLCLSGMPFLSGFYSKDLILESFLVGNASMVMVFCLILATCLTVCYSVRLCTIIMGGKGGVECNSGNLNLSYLIPMFMLQGLGVFEGGLIQSVACSSISFEFIYGYLKAVLLLILVLSVGLSLVFLMPNVMEFYSLVRFLTSIMYLSEMSGQVLSKGGLVLAKTSYVVMDQGVFEVYLGGKGLSKASKYFSGVSMQVSVVNTTYSMSFYALLFMLSMGVLSLIFTL